jgi:hypothetical protein
LDNLSINADRKSGTPDLPKYPDIIHMLNKIKITFQSTILKASTSEYIPKKTMKRMPSRAAMTLSIQPVMTRIMLTRKMTHDAIWKKSISQTPCFYIVL